MSICKYCGNPIEDEIVMNIDEQGNGYHHFCLVDKEFREEQKRIYDKGKEDASRWIPVSERLPEEHKEVLTCSMGGFIEIQSIENAYGGYWENQKGDSSDIDEVVAWMPLPEPYKTEILTGQEVEE